MSVLFQALNRAAGDYREQKRPDMLPFLSLSGRRHRARWGLICVALLVVGVVGGASYAFVAWQRQADLLAAVKPSLGTVGALTERPPAVEAEKKAEDTDQAGSPDLAQGIALSSDSLTETLPIGDVSAVAKRIKDLPAVVGAKTSGKGARIEVYETNVLSELSRTAHAAMAAGDYTMATELYSRILTQEPDNYAALAGKAYVLQQKGKLKEAADIDRRLLRRNPTDRLVRTNLVAALAVSNEPEAQGELLRIIKSDPDFAPAHAALAKWLSVQGDLDDAILSQKQALEIEPQNNIYRLSLAILCDHAEKREEALALYRQVLESRKETEGELPLAWTALEQRIKYLSSNSR